MEEHASAVGGGAGAALDGGSVAGTGGGSGANGRATPAPLPAPVIVGGNGLEGELARARERLAFYEGFDRLIQENIARSGELLRQAAEEREAALREAAAARAALDRELAGRQERERALLLALGDELVDLQGRTAALGHRVTAALDDVSAAPPIGGAVEPDLPLGPAPIRSAVPPDRPPVVGAETVGDEDGEAAPAGSTAVVDRLLAEAVAPAAGALASGATDLAAVAEPQPDDPAALRAIAVVVHGVPRAAAALALQRHLAGLAQVAAVEAREYAAGVLRLQVSSRGPLGLEDLRGWDGGGGLEAVHVLPDVVEVTLPGADGL